MLFVCLPEDEANILKEVEIAMDIKTSYKRIVITERDKSSEGWLIHVRATRPGLVL